MPVQIDIKVDAKGVIQGLEIMGRLLPGVTQKAAEAELQAGVKEIKTYPSKRPGQKYVRTGEYGRSTGLLVAPYQGGTKFTVYSAAIEAKTGKHYSGFVGGTSGGAPQAWMHKDRWTHIYTEIVKNRLPKIIGNVDAAIQSLIAKSGFRHY